MILAVVLVGGCGCLVLMTAVLFPVFAEAKLAAQRTTALKQFELASNAVLIYSADNAGRYPLSANWMDAVESYGGADQFRLPWREGDSYGIAFNSHLAGWSTTAVEQPKATVLLFASTNDSRNASGGVEILITPDESPVRRALVSHTDTSTSALEEDELDFLRWVPHPDWPDEPTTAEQDAP